MKQKKFVSLMMIALLLAGCDKKGNDSSTITPSGSDTVKPSDTVSETKPSASTSEKSPIASFLESLKAGYTRNFKLTYSNTLESVETEDGYLSSGEDSFSYFEPSYALNGDIVSEQMEFYEKGEGDSLLLCYLNFHNEVKKIPYTGAEKFSNYANAFLSAKETDFTKDGEAFSLSKDSASFALLASELKTSKDNLEYFKINLKDGVDSFSFQIKGSSDVSYETKLAEGTILTGKDNVIKVKPMEGREDPLFAKGRGWINNGNYNRKSTFSKYNKDIGDFVPSAVYAREADKEHSIAITTYDGNGTMLAQSGLSKADNGDIQSCIVINDERYPDGKAIKGNLSSALIAPQISSLFFDKTYTRNTNSGHKVAVYQLKDSLPAYVFKEKFNYLDSFADDSMERKDLSIAISDEAEDEFIQIINENQSRRYRVLYSDFGMVEDPIRYSSINENCDALTFGDYFTNNEDSFSVLKDDILSLDVLQNIPAFGSYYANVSFILSSESNQNLFEIKTTPVTQKNIVLTDITSLRTSYEAKLVEAGYTKVENPSEDELVDASDTLYKKTGVTYTDANGDEQTITLEVEVSVVSEDDGPHLVLYPTCVEETTEATESIL